MDSHYFSQLNKIHLNRSIFSQSETMYNVINVYDPIEEINQQNILPKKNRSSENH